MINTYDIHISLPPGFRQLAVKDMLFVYYRCPQAEKYANLFAHYNQISYTLSGKKTIHHSGKSWVLTDDTSVLVFRIYSGLRINFLPFVYEMVSTFRILKPCIIVHSVRITHPASHFHHRCLVMSTQVDKFFLLN